MKRRDTPFLALGDSFESTIRSVVQASEMKLRLMPQPIPAPQLEDEDEEEDEDDP
jgi:hypothetical protein